MFQSVFRTFWTCFLLFSVGSCFPFRKVQTGTGSGSSGGIRGDSLGFGSGSGYTAGDSMSGFGAGSGYVSGGTFSGSGSSLDAGIIQMVEDLLRLSPNRPYLQNHWNADQVPLGMVEVEPVYPSSHIIHTSSGYRRAQDSRTDTKYTQDTFDHIPLPGAPQDQPGTGSKWETKTK